MVYHNVNRKLNHTFNCGLIHYMGNYTQFSIQRLNSESIGQGRGNTVSTSCTKSHITTTKQKNNTKNEMNFKSKRGPSSP